MDAEFLNEYINKLAEEASLLLKEKAFLRARESNLLKEIEHLHITINTLNLELEKLRKKTKKTTEDY